MFYLEQSPQSEVARLFIGAFQSMLLEQWYQRSLPGGADLVPRPARLLEVTVFSPVGLNEDVIDLLKFHCLSLSLATHPRGLKFFAIREPFVIH